MSRGYPEYVGVEPVLKLVPEGDSEADDLCLRNGVESLVEDEAEGEDDNDNDDDDRLLLLPVLELELELEMVPFCLLERSRSDD